MVLQLILDHLLEQLTQEWQVGYRTIAFQLIIVAAAFFQQSGDDRVFKRASVGWRVFVKQ